MSAIVLRQLSKRFAGTQAGLVDVSLSINAGEHFVIAGPSGAGKTTLLRLIAGLERPELGAISFDERDVTAVAPRLRNVSLVSQRPTVYPHLTVRRNLSASIDLRQAASMFALRRRTDEQQSVTPRERARRVEEAGAILGLTPLLDRRADQLSGGEQQRVALGRAWVARTPLWLLDEPFAHLDFPQRAQLRAVLHLLRERFRTTMIEVTHDPADALALGRRVAVLRDGRLEQVGLAAELYARPASRTVALALGSPAPGEAHQGGQADDGAGARLGEWNIVRCVATGPGWLATLEQGGRVWQAWLREAPQAQRIPLSVRLEHLLVFAADGRRL